MASSTRGGKRGKTKRVKMKPAESGGQIYMSEDYAKKFKDTRAGNTALQKKIEEKITERMLAGEMTPKESGSLKARTWIDQARESNRQKYENKKYGGEVRGYEGGGEVCRGNGRAYQGKPKKVQVR